MSSLEASGEPLASIRTLFDALVEQASPDCGGRGCFLVNTSLALQAHDDEVRLLVSSALEDTRKFFKKQLEHAKIRGDLAQEIDPDATASGLLAILVGIRVMSRGAADTAVIRQMADQAMRLLGTEAVA